MNRITIEPRGSMGVKVRERPPNSGKWWIFTDWKGKRSARFIPQGKRAAEEVAKRIAEKLNLIESNRQNGVSFSMRELDFRPAGDRRHPSRHSPLDQSSGHTPTIGSTAAKREG